ncbi:MAG: hypothetical protein ABRQ39_17300 [Candidatus Eremiobacterota bacterium]
MKGILKIKLQNCNFSEDYNPLSLFIFSLITYIIVKKIPSVKLSANSNR